MNARAGVALAWKNLFRHGRRTIITASALAFGLLVYIMADSMLRGIEVDTERNLILYETGAAQVLAEGYLEERDLRPLRYAIEIPEEIESALEESGIKAVARTTFSGELIVFQDPFPEDGSVQVTGYGIDPSDDGDVYRLEETITKGRFLEPGEDGAVLGGWLAEDIGADVGYPITIVTRTRGGFFQTLELDVVGIADTPNPIINRYALFIPIDTADFYLQMEGAVTEIAVAGKLRGVDRALTAQMEQELASFPGVDVVGWDRLAMDYVAIAQTKNSGSSTILFFVFVIAAVGVSNTVLMSILERRREIGMMRAMGLYDGEIRRLLLLEAAGIGVIGAGIGIALGAVTNYFLVTNGIDYSFWLRDMDAGYRITGVLRGVWNGDTFASAFAAGVIITVITAMMPVRRALRTTIVESLRTD